MGKLILAAATAFVIGSPTCGKVREAGNHFKNIVAHYFSMPEPGATAFKPRKSEEDKKAAERLQATKIKPVETYKYSFTFENGDKLYIDKRRGVAKVVEPDGRISVEGRIVKDPSDPEIIVAIDDPRGVFELAFMKSGFMVFIPKLNTESVISR